MLKIQRYQPDHFAYGIPCQPLYPWSGRAETPFGSMWCVVPPGGSVKAHRHHEAETYIFAQGHGTLRVGDESTPISPGDAVLMDPFETHEVVNPTADETILFLAVWWEDMELARRAAQAAAEKRAARPRRVLLTATPPTPNGDLHAGHLSGPYLAADIHRRYLKARGVEAIYLSGADDHQSYVPAKGERLGLTAREVADRFGDEIEATLQAAEIELDLFVRPQTSRHHVPFVQSFFRALYDKGAFVEKESPGLFCPACDRYLYQAHVSGRCPSCGAGSDGNACEQCGRPNQVVDLLEPACKRCGARPEVRPVKRLYFPLSRHRDALAEWHRSLRMSSHLRALCARMIDELPDIAATHPAEWGIPVPVPGYEDQTIYVWLEMAPGFLAATDELLAQREGNGSGPRSWEELWRGGDTRLVQFFGFDNGYYHALLFPALWMAYDPSIRLPAAFVTNEFLRLDGAKFSTSRGHAIWGRDLLARVPADVARFYLAWIGPEREQTNFTLRDLDETVERELTQGWEAWLQDLGRRTRARFDGAVPGTGAWTDAHQELFTTLARFAAQVGECYEAETFSPARAVRLLSELVREARRFAQAEAHWTAVPKGEEEMRTAFALELAAARSLAILAAPVMPGFARRLWRALGYGEPEQPGHPMMWEDAPGLVPPGQRLAGLDEIAVGAPAAQPAGTRS